ncbi:MAG: avhR [Rhizobium sp.]|nr:avhR [Rhizobium sp.]
MDSDPKAGVGNSIGSRTTSVETHAISPEATLAASVAALAQAQRFDFYWVGSFPSVDNPGLAINRIADNWPESLSRAYDASGVFYASRLVEALSETILPVFSGAAAFDIYRGTLRVRLSAEFERHGFSHTLGFSINDCRQKRFLVLLSGKHEAADNLALIFFSVVGHIDAFSRELAGERLSRRTLGNRETECLRWAAAGKSSEEIALILGISPHTVNFYLKTAAQKLGGVNRMHTVSRAMQLKII